MNLQLNDKAYEALRVGSLEVVGEMTGATINSINTHLEVVEGVQLKQSAQMNRLFKELSDDGIISANEKILLKKEIDIIQSEYPIILQKAQDNKKEAFEIEAYKTAYTTLIHYLYSELKIFDDMTSPLDIDREAFNQVFVNYYKSRAVLHGVKDGKDGLIHYTWIKFAKDANGTDMSDYPDDSRQWMGISENNLVQKESNNPSDYKWVNIRGKEGIPGANGKSKYIWIKYADDAQGGGISDNPMGKTYIGFAWNKETKTESTNPADYHWQKVKGEDGEDGIPGKDGTTKFLPSLSVNGDYENQIGTYQGQLYRWTNGEWVLLNAVMPTNPVAYYDFEDKNSIITKTI